jgi:hypothetical protein
VWWVIGISWGFALLVAIVVLGYCVYELRSKAVRLRRDLGQLSGAAAHLTDLQARLRVAQERLAAFRTER